MTIDTRTITFKITGKVQGVWFRAYSRDSALSLNIDGWVKNDPDGSVFGKAVGSEKNMKITKELLDIYKQNKSSK